MIIILKTQLYFDCFCCSWLVVGISEVLYFLLYFPKCCILFRSKSNKTTFQAENRKADRETDVRCVTLWCVWIMKVLLLVFYLYSHVWLLLNVSFPWTASNQLLKEISVLEMQFQIERSCRESAEALALKVWLFTIFL